MFFAEVAQQGLMAAGGGFAEAEQGIELLQFDALAFFGRIAGKQHLAHRHDIAQAVGHPRIRGQAVASGASGFLIVAFHALGQIEVGDEAHVGLVDAHAEGDGGDHDDAFFAQESFLVFVARGGIQSGVIGQRIPALLFEPRGGLIDLLARQAIHDACIVGVFGFEKGLQLLPRVVLLRDAVADVGTVEAGNELLCLFQRQSLDDLAPRRCIGCGGECDARHAGEAFVQHSQRAVLGAEIVTPLRDAVRFVDGEQGDIVFLLQSLQQVEETLRHQPFRRDIQQLQLAAQQLP